MKITGIDTWLNGEPTTIAEQAAMHNVVLIDFWTYTCINCLRTIPRLQSWQEKYGDRGLTIIGVHSPEFEFEKNTENVQDAIDRLGVSWLVAQDNEMETWRAFDNNVWPAKFLFSSGGLSIYQHFGEGEYNVTETRIRQALTAAGHDISDIPFERLQEDVRDPFSLSETPEIYAGYAASYQPQGLYNGHPRFYTGPDQVLVYEDPGDGFRTNGRYYLQGAWENRVESIVHARQTEDLEDYIALAFGARSVNVVIKPVSSEPLMAPFEVVIEIDDRPLTPDEAGADIVFTDLGESVIQVLEPRLYALIETSEYTQANLKMRSNSNNFAVFAWTFGTYLDGA
ncbi:MAG: redoxin domain-containing protein [Chloroflexi bacterium]|nr:redoxin domain-containing protein [Chloroflexota bacterium]